jgi:hypothetical protein
MKALIVILLSVFSLFQPLSNSMYPLALSARTAAIYLEELDSYRESGMKADALSFLISEEGVHHTFTHPSWRTALVSRSTDFYSSVTYDRCVQEYLVCWRNLQSKSRVVVNISDLSSALGGYSRVDDVRLKHLDSQNSEIKRFCALETKSDQVESCDIQPLQYDALITLLRFILNEVQYEGLVGFDSLKELSSFVISLLNVDKFWVNLPSLD